MKNHIALILAVILSTSAFAQDAQLSPDPEPPVLDIRSGADVTLDEFLWINRLIVVFADTDRDPSFQKQMAFLAERPEELQIRDVVVITDTDPENPSSIRTQLRPRGFGLVFVDKDGVVKLRKPGPWDVREITRSIDKTPLRIQEVRDRR